MELRLPQGNFYLNGNLKNYAQERSLSRFCLGHFNHACSVVKPGRSFIGRLIFLLTEAKCKHRNLTRINSEARSDIRWWHMFIESWNSISILQQQALSHPDHDLWSNASVSCMGHSCLLEFRLDSVSVATCHPTILGHPCALWGRQWKGTTVRTNCNNKAVVIAINSRYTWDPFLMHVLRCIFFFSATFDFNLTAAHIPGCYNTLADAISRNKHVLRGIKKEHSKQVNITKSRLPITPNSLIISVGGRGI